MLDSADHFESSDATRLAMLHGSALSTSALGRMGAGTLARYYRWVTDSAHECLFISRAGPDIQGAAVLSFEPATVLRRFAAGAPLAFVGALGASLLRDGTFRADVAAYLRERLRRDRDPAAAPELLQIFVDGPERNRSIGSHLLDRVEVVLQARGADRYYVRTLVEENAQTLGFYARRGFTTVRELDFCGARYVLLSKTVPNGRR